MNRTEFTKPPYFTKLHQDAHFLLLTPNSNLHIFCLLSHSLFALLSYFCILLMSFIARPPIVTLFTVAPLCHPRIVSFRGIPIWLQKSITPTQMDNDYTSRLAKPCLPSSPQILCTRHKYITLQCTNLHTASRTNKA